VAIKAKDGLGNVVNIAATGDGVNVDFVRHTEVKNFPLVQPVSATQLPLPSGAASEATLAALSGKVPTLSNGKVPVDVAFPATQPVSGTVNVGNLPTTQSVSGSVSVSNFPSSQTVSGSVVVSNFPATQNVSVTNLPATQNVSGSVNVANHPPFLFDASGNLRVSGISGTGTGTTTTTPNTEYTEGSSPATASGIVSLGRNSSNQLRPLALNASNQALVSVVNLPATQPVSGSVSVGNFPATQAVSGTVSIGNFPATQPVSGSVSVSNQAAFAFDANGNLRVNFPTTQAISGSVSISNFPATQPVSGTVSIGNFPSTQAISASSLPLPTGAATETTLASLNGKLPSALAGDRLKVDVAFPANQTVSGTVSVGNFPATQTISGSVSVSNFPATQPISAASLPLPSGAATESTLASLNGKIPTALTSQGGLNVGGSALDIVARNPTQIKRAPISVAASGDNPVIAGVTGQKVKVLGMTLVANGDVNVLIKSGTTNLSGSIPMASKGNGFVLPQNFVGYHWLEGVDAGNLVINLSAAIAVTGFLLYAQEA
jgi:hypothetical protein